MSKQFWPPAALLPPAPPALVTCGTLEKPNILTIAWTGIVCSKPAMTYVSIRPERFSYGIIKERGEFCVNICTPELVFAADYCGVKSGRDIDKFGEMKLTPVAASKIAPPLIAESPLSLECRVTQVIPFGSHDMFLAEILAVAVNESCLDEAGKLDLGKCGVAAYSHGEYFKLGKRLGSMGYSVRKKKKHK